MDAASPTAAPLQARFNPLIRSYLLLMGVLYLLMTIVFSPLIIVWLLGVGQWWSRHYFDRLGCTLSDTALQFRKGIVLRVEKTVPLENIQDVTFIEGPLLRMFHLSVLRIETAGSSPGQAHSMSLAGIVDAHALRDDILRRREALRQRAALPAPASVDERQLVALDAIRGRLDEIAALLRAGAQQRD